MRALPGKARIARRSVVLRSLIRLKQTCNHPSQLAGDGEYPHVIHFDRWWNPAVENQATDRAFRIGQRRNLLVHRFVTRGTIEEKIDRMIAEKRQLADDLLDGEHEVNLTELSDDELIDMVRLDVTRANPQAAS